MAGFRRPEWRALRVSCAVIERMYGRGNFDDAGDDIVEALRCVSDYPGQYRHRFDLDSSHPNPWFHALVFEVEGIADVAYRRLVGRVHELGLGEVAPPR